MLISIRPLSEMVAPLSLAVGCSVQENDSQARSDAGCIVIENGELVTIVANIFFELDPF